MAITQIANPFYESVTFDSATGKMKWGDMTTAGKLTLGSSLFSAFGGMFTSINAASAANHLADVKAQIAEINAGYEQLKANAALDAANKQVGQITMKYGAVKAKQKTAYAANGIKLNTAGSAAEVMTTTDVVKEIDAHQAYANGLAAAWGYQSKATAYKMAAAAARASKSSVGFVGAGSLLTGLANTGTKAFNMANFNYKK